MKGDPYCACGHPQSFHDRGVGRCRCGCLAPRLHRRGVELVELLEPGSPPLIAPLYRVRCPDCPPGRTYETRSWPREIIRRRRCRPCADARRARRPRRPGSTRPSDLPAAEAFADRPHGTRVRYVAGCRCDACREANNGYERMRGKLRRAGQTNELVDAARVRRHLVKLSAAGVGRDTVSDVAGVPASSIDALRSGKKTKLRRQTSARLLAVGADVLTDAKLVDAAPTWKRIARMLADGFTRGAIALRLGRKTPALQIRRARVTARTADRVERLYREIYPS